MLQITRFKFTNVQCSIHVRYLNSANDKSKSEFAKKLKNLSKTEQRKLGEKVPLIGNSNLHYASRVGIVDRVKQDDGSVISLVYPKMIYRKKRLNLFNIRFPEGEQSPWNVKDITTGLPSEFSKGLRTISEECTFGAEYYFENGMRKVR